MIKFEEFIPQNVAPENAQGIGLYKSDTLKYQMNLGHLAFGNLGAKRYSFLAISDIHMTGAATDDGTTDLNRAIQFANDNNINFICACGDVCDNGTEYVFQKFKNIRESAGIPIYAVTGNHETGDYSSGAAGVFSAENIKTYYGYPLYYSFKRGNDVFVMLSQCGWVNNPVFCDGELQFLYETLEKNRNRRCFVFFHTLTGDDGDCGAAEGKYYSDLTLNRTANQTDKTVFLSMLKHYKNAIWFHGHSHAMLQLQKSDKNANYSENNGYKSIHIPSLGKPKTIEYDAVVTLTEGSQGYVVDVYDNYIVLKGRDFVAEKFLPIAMYKIRTPIKSVAAGTFADDTGTITT